MQRKNFLMLFNQTPANYFEVNGLEMSRFLIAKKSSFDTMNDDNFTY